MDRSKFCFASGSPYFPLCSTHLTFSRLSLSFSYLPSISPGPCQLDERWVLEWDLDFDKEYDMTFVKTLFPACRLWIEKFQKFPTLPRKLTIFLRKKLSGEQRGGHFLIHAKQTLGFISGSSICWLVEIFWSRRMLKRRELDTCFRTISQLFRMMKFRSKEAK